MTAFTISKNGANAGRRRLPDEVVKTRLRSEAKTNVLVARSRTDISATPF